MENPIDLLSEITLKLSPTAIEYEVGSSLEMFLFSLLESFSDKVDRIVVVSMYDFFFMAYKFINFSFDKAVIDKIMKKAQVVSVNPVSEVVLKSRIISFLTPEALSKRVVAEITKYKNQKTLAVIMGSELYALKEGLQQFISLYQYIVSSPLLNNQLGLVTLINFKLLPDTLLEVVRGYSMNVARLYVDDNQLKDAKRCLLFYKFAIPKYELRRWCYVTTDGQLTFSANDD